MNYAIIENDIVTNIVVSEAALEDTWVQSDTAAIGDRYEDGQFIRPEPPPAPVPHSVTPRQARLALLGAGLLSQVEAAIAGMTDPEKTVATINWEYATAIVRTDGWVVGLSGALGLTDEQLDQLFIQASVL